MSILGLPTGVRRVLSIFRGKPVPRWSVAPTIAVLSPPPMAGLLLVVTGLLSTRARVKGAGATAPLSPAAAAGANTVVRRTANCSVGAKPVLPVRTPIRLLFAVNAPVTSVLVVAVLPATIVFLTVTVPPLLIPPDLAIRLASVPTVAAVAVL